MPDSPLKVLLVDDDPEILEVLENVVETAGGRPVPFTAATEAVRVLEAHAGAPFAMIISDYNMPGMNGVAFRVKGFEYAQDTPFYFLSAHVTDEMRGMEKELQVRGFLDKPFEFEQVVDVVRECLLERLVEYQSHQLQARMRIDEAEAILERLLPHFLRFDVGMPEALPAATRRACELVTALGETLSFFRSKVINGLTHRAFDLLTQLGGAAGEGAALHQSLLAYVMRTVDGIQDNLWILKKRTEPVFDVDATVRAIEEARRAKSSLAPSLAKASGPTSGKRADSSVASGTPAANAERRVDTVRVPTHVLDEFVELAGENTVLRNIVSRVLRAVESELPGNRHVTMLGELLEEMYKTNTRMHTTMENMRKVPVGQMWRGFPRTVRDLCSRLGKEVALKTLGDDILVDSSLGPAIGDCLMHLLRNSLDHGLEGPQERAQAGKAPQGVVTIVAVQGDEELVITISDDGRGISSARVGAKAVERGLTTPLSLATLPRERILRFILEPGFSTSSAVTDISGRGVGMDMVKSSLDALGGKLLIDTEEGKGSRFTLVIPEPKGVRILNALSVRAAGHAFALPQADIEYVSVLSPTARREAIVEEGGGLVFRSRGMLLSLLDLRRIFASAPPAPAALGHARVANPDEDRGEVPGEPDLHVLIVKGESVVFAVAVDEIVDSEEIVVKPMPAHLAHLRVYLGATFMGVDGVCPVLDVQGIAQVFNVRVPEREAWRDASREAFDASGRGTTHAAPGNTGHTPPVELLTFKLRSPATYGLRVSHVYRLEELDSSRVRYQFGEPVVVYRDEAVPLVFPEKVLAGGGGGKPFERDEWLSPGRVIPMVIAECEGTRVALAVREIGDYRVGNAPMDATLARADIEGCLDVEGRLVTVVDLRALLTRTGHVAPPRPQPILDTAKETGEGFRPTTALPLSASPPAIGPPAFDANGLLEDDGIVWVDVG